MVDGTSGAPALSEVVSSLATVAARTERERFREPFDLCDASAFTMIKNKLKIPK